MNKELKSTLKVLSVVIISFSALLYALDVHKVVFGGVNQNIQSSPICDYGDCLVTYAWKSGHIVFSKYDDTQTLTDSIVLLRQKQARQVLDALSKAE